MTNSTRDVLARAVANLDRLEPFTDQEWDLVKDNPTQMWQAKVDALLPTVEALVAESEKNRKDWAFEAAIAIDAATIIGKRSCDRDDPLGYSNHHRLLRDYDRLFPPLVALNWRSIESERQA